METRLEKTTCGLRPGKGAMAMQIMVIDGNSLLNRAFYGVKTPLTTSAGQPTGALLGFMNILLKLVGDHEPDGLCVTFDLRAPTFRHKAYEGYKAGRKPMPEELASQVPLCKHLLDAMCIPRYEREGFEADDLIGTISRVSGEAGWDCRIVTGDRDCFQLIGERVQVLHISSRMGRTDTTPYDEGAIRAEYGMSPADLIDLKALMGDASDNIPGVPGIGEKTALELMHRFGSLDALYEGYEDSDVKPGVKSKLEKGRASAFMSRDLARIDRFVPLTFDPADTRRVPYNNNVLYELLCRLEFRKLIEKMRVGGPGGGKRKMENAPDAASAEHSPAPDGFDWLPVVEETAPTALQALLDECRLLPRVGFLCDDDLSVLYVCTGSRTVVVRRMGVDAAAYETCLRGVLASDIAKVSHHVKPLMRQLKDAGIPYGGFVADTALAGYLLAPAQGKYPLDAMIQAELSVWAGDMSAQASCLLPLSQRQQVRLTEQELDGVMADMELPLCDVLADMEHIGCKVDRDKLHAFGRQLHERLLALETDIYELAGEQFNLNSPKQLGEILFERLGLPAVKKTKTGYSTDVEVLQKLKSYHPVVAKIMEYRMLSKLKSTYVDGLLAVIGTDGRVHTNFQMTVTATGRLSSTEPNLQNIPIRTELGGELRRLFVPEDEDCVLVDADYSQIELRVLAHIAGDTVMQEAFAAGEDIHAVTASQVFGVPIDEVTALMRRHAKAVNFGIVYGISAFSLGEDIGVSPAEAKTYIENYLAKYAGVRDYMNNIVEQAKKDGYVTTLLGRRRWLPELKASNFNVRSFGERVALNTPIQGTAADIIKLAMLAVHRRLCVEGLSARLILQVHDELIVECPRSEAERVMRLLTEEMERVYALNPPLLAESHAGPNWLEAK